MSSLTDNVHYLCMSQFCATYGYFSCIILSCYVKIYSDFKFLSACVAVPTNHLAACLHSSMFMVQTVTCSHNRFTTALGKVIRFYITEVPFPGPLS